MCYTLFEGKKMEIKEIVSKQREYFYTKETYDVKFRKKVLLEIKNLLFKYKEEFIIAFKKDYNKCEFDVITTEFSMVVQEINYMIKHIDKLSKAKRVRTSIVNFPSKGYIVTEPYGVVLIMAPWNYPLQLTLEPLIGAIASGNTVVLKPASYTSNVSKVIFDMFKEYNHPELIWTVLGGREENQELLNQRFDYIFFTGGETVGRLVLQKASVYLTPVTLELGGKSPCIVDKDADIDIAVRRITWGKFLNAGQTCVAPDYICVHKDIHDEFIKKVKEQIVKFYYVDGKIIDSFPYLINQKHLDKVTSLIDKEKVVFGGKADGLLLEPTIMDNVNFKDEIMKEEIFGPVMPIIIFDNLEELLDKINRLEKPLAFYYFSKDKKKARKVMKYSFYGGGCINDTIMHLTNDNLPFGGVGRSGMGSYHGKKSFETFSHYKSLLVKSKREIMIKYPPYNDKKINIVNKLYK